MGSRLAPILANTFMGIHETGFATILAQNHYFTVDTLTIFSVFFTTRTGFYSKLTQRRLTSLAKRLCTDLEIKHVFSSYKIKNLFSLKDPVPNELKSFVVYQFTCAGCNSRYIGETSGHLSTRIKEHISTNKNFHIHKHFLKSPSCKNQYSQSCFKILDSANSTFSLKIKEALHRNKVNPELNVQVHHFNTIFSL